MDLQTILELMDQIQRCRSVRGPEALGATIGELDTAAELHRVIHTPRRKYMNDSLRMRIFERDKGICPLTTLHLTTDQGQVQWITLFQ